MPGLSPSGNGRYRRRVVRPHNNHKGGGHSYSPHQDDSGERHSMGTCSAVACRRLRVPLLSHLLSRHLSICKTVSDKKNLENPAFSMLHQRSRYEDHPGSIQETNTTPSRCSRPQCAATRDKVCILDLAREKEPRDWSGEIHIRTTFHLNRETHLNSFESCTTPPPSGDRGRVGH